MPRAVTLFQARIETPGTVPVTVALIKRGQGRADVVTKHKRDQIVEVVSCAFKTPGQIKKAIDRYEKIAGKALEVSRVSLWSIIRGDK